MKTDMCHATSVSPQFHSQTQYQTRRASHEKEATTNDTVSLIQGQTTLRRRHKALSPVAAVQGDHSGRKKPPVDLVTALLASGGPLL